MSASKFRQTGRARTGRGKANVRPLELDGEELVHQVLDLLGAAIDVFDLSGCVVELPLDLVGVGGQVLHVLDLGVGRDRHQERRAEQGDHRVEVVQGDEVPGLVQERQRGEVLAVQLQQRVAVGRHAAHQPDPGPGRGDGQWQEATDYIDVVAWGPLGERVAQYLTKGRPVLVNGRLQSRSWEQDGQKRSKVEVNAQDVTFLGGRGEGDGGSDYGSAPAAKPAAKKSTKKQEDVQVEDLGDEPINLDDIPF